MCVCVNLSMNVCTYHVIIFSYAGNKSGGRNTVGYLEDNDYVKERDTSSSGQYIKSRVFKNRYSDSGGRSFGSESTGRSRPFMGDENHSRFPDDVELRVNSGDIGRIIGMLISILELGSITKMEMVRYCFKIS